MDLQAVYILNASSSTIFSFSCLWGCTERPSAF